MMQDGGAALNGKVGSKFQAAVDVGDSADFSSDAQARLLARQCTKDFK